MKSFVPYIAAVFIGLMMTSCSSMPTHTPEEEVATTIYLLGNEHLDPDYKSHFAPTATVEELRLLNQKLAEKRAAVCVQRFEIATSDVVIESDVFAQVVVSVTCDSREPNSVELDLIKDRNDWSLTDSSIEKFLTVISRSV